MALLLQWLRCIVLSSCIGQKICREIILQHSPHDALGKWQPLVKISRVKQFIDGER
jgi:hypothetical protein